MLSQVRGDPSLSVAIIPTARAVCSLFVQPQQRNVVILVLQFRILDPS